MKEYDGRGVDDDYIVRAAERIVRQYHLEQNDRSEDSAQAAVLIGTRNVDPDNPHALRLAIDEVTVRLDNFERLLVKREKVFLAALERVERNLAKSDGAMDALGVEVTRLASQPQLATETRYEDWRREVAAMVSEVTSALGLARALLDEARDIHSAALLGEAAQDSPSPL